MKFYLPQLLIGFCLLLFLPECKKKPVDRRNKYTGTWQFHYTVRSASKGNPESITSADYTGQITYDGRNDKDHRVHLILSKDWDEEFEVDKDGSLIQCEKRGKFESEKSLSLVGTSAGCHTQLGAEISYTITGTR